MIKESVNMSHNLALRGNLIKKINNFFKMQFNSRKEFSTVPSELKIEKKEWQHSLRKENQLGNIID